MKPFRSFLDRLKPLFGKDGRLEKLFPMYEAVDTFLYTPGDVTSKASHIRDGMDLKRMMSTVVVALLPCIIMAMWNTGYQNNNTIRNRRVAEILKREGLLVTLSDAQQEGDKDQTARPMLDEAMRRSVGRPLEDVVIEMLIENGMASVDAHKSVEGELYDESKIEAIPLSDIGYKTDWHGELYQSLGFGFTPQSWLANLVFGALYFIPIYLVCNIVGGAWEMLFACVRRHEINEGFLVTGFLFPLTLPAAIPLWQVALGISFGVVIGKEVFGGTGKNFLNPALTARAFLYFSYANDMVGDTVWTAVDGFSGATPLGQLAVAKFEAGMKAIDVIDVSWAQAFLGTIPGSLGETSTLACLFGALVLIVTGVGSWRIMAGMLLGGLAASTLFWEVIGSNTNPMFLMPPWWHLVTGGFAFGMVFMATDPVSAAMTKTGKYYYGALIGVMTILVRVVNPAFPEGVMLAILFGNVFAPLIDYCVVQSNIKRRIKRNAA